MTAGMWCTCKHYLWLGDERPTDDDPPISCAGCHPKQPCFACGKPGVEQAHAQLEGGWMPTYGRPAPVEVREYGSGQ